MVHARPHLIAFRSSTSIFTFSKVCNEVCLSLVKPRQNEPGATCVGCVWQCELCADIALKKNIYKSCTIEKNI